MYTSGYTEHATIVSGEQSQPALCCIPCPTCLKASVNWQQNSERQGGRKLHQIYGNGFKVASVLQPVGQQYRLQQSSIDSEAQCGFT